MCTTCYLHTGEYLPLSLSLSLANARFYETENGVPYCDLDVYVDNIGKYIVKKYRVHSERNNSPTVVTAVINIELQQNKADTKNIQFIENLKPRYWQGTLTEEAIQCLMGKEIENACNDFREYRYCYLHSLFQFLSSSDDMENLIVKEIYDLELPFQIGAAVIVIKYFIIAKLNVMIVVTLFPK